MDFTDTGGSINWSDVGSSPTYDPTQGSSSSGNSGFNWGALTNSAVQAGGNVFTQVLKNQALGSQAKAAAAQSSSMMTIIVIAVVGLLGVGILFAFLGRKK